MTTLEHMARAVNMVRDSLEKGVPTVTTTYEAKLLADLAEAERIDNLTQRTVLGLMIDAYRRAKAEDAQLLEAAKSMASVLRNFTMYDGKTPDNLVVLAQEAMKQYVAAFEKGGPQ